jgi:uroporphyrinogen decarboxylase
MAAAAMTRRQRVLTALNRVQPDRVPVDFGAHRSSGIMAIAYRKLRRQLGLPDRLPRVYDMIQQLAIIDDDVLDRFGIDTIELGRGFCREDKYWKEWCLPDGSDCLIPAWVDARRQDGDWVLYGPAGTPIGIQKAGALYFEQTHWPYLDGVPDDLSGLPAVMPNITWSVPAPPGPGLAGAALADGAEKLRAATDRAIVGLFGGNLLEWGQFLCRNDRFFVLLGREPADARRRCTARRAACLADGRQNPEPAWWG